MGSGFEQEVTGLLRRAKNGDDGAMEALVPLVHGELRGIARGLLVREGPGHTLQPTALVNEAWLRIAAQDSMGFEQRAQFFGAAGRVMRRILVDHARSKRARKRGDGDRPEPLDGLDETLAAFERDTGDLIDLDEALEELAAKHPRKARLVELRFFLGMDMREAAANLAVSLRQAERDWAVSRAWLGRRLGRAPE